MRQLKSTEVSEVLGKLKKAQGNVCAVCGKPFTKKDVPCLDHDHETGVIRGVLHRTCNGIEGKMKALGYRSHAGVKPYEYIIGLGKYLEKHSQARTQLIHPSHMTDEMKRELRNKKARAARARKKKAG